jgi:CRP-like cAMP-binding protein
MQTMRVQAGATIFQMGDPSLAVFIVEEGEVAITVHDGIEVARLHPGELFGESGVLENRPRAANATAITATSLLVTSAESFVHAFGMKNDRALSLVKLLCRRLRSTSMRVAHGTQLAQSEAVHAAIHLSPDHPRLSGDYHMETVDVTHLPFQVGNRYGGETLSIASNHSCSIPAHGDSTLAAPHFEILRRDGRVGVRDLGTSTGTIVNGTAICRASLTAFVPLRAGDNTVIAGPPQSPFRFRVHFASA